MKTIARITTAVLLATTLSLTASCKGEGGGAEDWSAAALKAQTLTLGGASVSWSIPDGLSKDDMLSDENSVTMKSTLGAPSVSLKKESIPPSTLDSAANTVGFVFGKGAETLEQREDAGRFVIALADGEKHRLMVAHFIPTKAGMFKCQVSQSKSGGIPNFDASLAKFHEICNSVKSE
ncbi:hypothetical protein ACNOYE_04145 [Nannocystaceae bacterium ST9]